MAHSPFANSGAEGQRPKMRLPRQFLTSTPMVVTEKTRIVAAASPGEEDGDPREDGWFLSDFYAMNYLYKGQGAHQVWLTAADPRALLENFGSYYHGNPREERKVVLSQELLESELTAPTVVRSSEIIERLKDEVRHAAAAAVRDGGNVLLLIFCHGLEHRFCLNTLDHENRLTVRELKEASGPDARLTLVASACYAGGWIVYPDVNATERAAASPEEDTSPSWIDSDSLRRECGFLFVDAITRPFRSRSGPFFTEEDDALGPHSEDAVKTQEEASAAFIRSAANALTHRLYLRVAFQKLKFSVQDDDWGGVWAEGALAPYERRWNRLEAHEVQASELTRYRLDRRPARPGLRKKQPAASWSMKKRVRLLAILYLELCPGDDVVPLNHWVILNLRRFRDTGHPQLFWRRRSCNIFAIVQYRVGKAHLVDNLVDFFQLPRPEGGPECLTWGRHHRTVGNYVDGSIIRNCLSFPQSRFSVQGPRCERAQDYLSVALTMANKDEETTRQRVDQINALFADVIAHGKTRVLADPEVRQRAHAWAQAVGRHVRADLLP